MDVLDGGLRIGSRLGRCVVDNRRMEDEGAVEVVTCTKDYYNGNDGMNINRQNNNCCSYMEECIENASPYLWQPSKLVPINMNGNRTRNLYQGDFLLQCT